jgi:hypothetical protein
MILGNLHKCLAIRACGRDNQTAPPLFLLSRCFGELRATKCHQCGAAVQIELHDLAIRVKIQSGIFVREWNFVWYAGLKIPLSIPL